MDYRLGIDVGGTFTDLVLFNETTKEITLAKVPSTPENQALGIINGIRKIIRQTQITENNITFLLHGTTVATNAVLEGKMANTALITTSGFKDVLHIMRQDRPKLYDFFARRPEPLIPRHLRFEVLERTLYTGEIQKKLNEKNLENVIKEIKRYRVTAVAVCFLHSYVNPLHERRVKEILTKAEPSIHVSLSCEVAPEIKEYERMSTTAMNASLMPVVQKYLNDLQNRLNQQGIKKPVYVMQSNGGLMSSPEAGRKSVGTILSGPAAGVIGGAALAKQAGFENLITVDMGGTSFDICLIHKGQPRFTRTSEIGSYALNVPMIDIHSVGAGGGSVAWIDRGKVLKVGPRSAGANPGPACYDRGGMEPTVTDANLVLNRLNSGYFLGGEMKVDTKAAYESIKRKIAHPLGVGVLKAAEGIIRIVNAGMARGIRFVSVEKGYDPRDFTLICFGGNGPLHGVELAYELNIPRVCIPFAPGLNCAYGLLVADFRHDYVKTYLGKFSELKPAEIYNSYAEMEKTGRNKMRENNLPDKNLIIQRTLDIRYRGQSYELEIPVPSGKISGKTLQTISSNFHRLHKKTYGFNKPGEPIEVVNLRMNVSGKMSKPMLNRQSSVNPDAQPAFKEKRRVFLRGRFYDTAIYDRNRFQPGMVITGPAIIEQKDSTTLLFPGNTAQVDPYKNIIITVKKIK